MRVTDSNGAEYVVEILPSLGGPESIVLPGAILIAATGDEQEDRRRIDAAIAFVLWRSSLSLLRRN